MKDEYRVSYDEFDWDDTCWYRHYEDHSTWLGAKLHAIRLRFFTRKTINCITIAKR